MNWGDDPLWVQMLGGAAIFAAIVGFYEIAQALSGNF